jgi:hypothetical protein
LSREFVNLVELGGGVTGGWLAGADVFAFSEFAFELAFVFAVSLSSVGLPPPPPLLLAVSTFGRMTKK